MGALGPLLPLRVVAFAAALPLWLRCLPLRALASLAEPVACAATPPADLLPLVRRVDRILSVARPLVRSGCLVRGLTLYRFLRRAGAPVVLRFGVDLEGHGHCWIEHGREPLAERRDPRAAFTITWSIEPSGTR